MIEVDHFTPLSRAVASIDRDAYAARYAVYDQAHKALLRRLATADASCSDADIAREEQAFRDAIRRIEFADTDAQPTLVPQDEPLADEPLANEPLGAAPPDPRRDLVWPRPRPRRETLDVADLPSLDHFESGSAAVPMLRLSEPRSLARRVGERMALAAMALVLIGVGLWMDAGRRDKATDQPVDPASLRGAESTEPAASDGATDAKDAKDAKAQQPTWLSPEMFYAPPPMPSAPASPRADVPLPTPRPER